MIEKANKPFLYRYLYFPYIRIKVTKTIKHTWYKVYFSLCKVNITKLAKGQIVTVVLLSVAEQPGLSLT